MMKIGFFYTINDEDWFQVLVLVHFSFTLHKGNTIQSSKKKKILHNYLAWLSVRTTRLVFLNCSVISHVRMCLCFSVCPRFCSFSFYCRIFFLIAVKLCTPAAQYCSTSDDFHLQITFEFGWFHSFKSHYYTVYILHGWNFNVFYSDVTELLTAVLRKAFLAILHTFIDLHLCNVNTKPPFLMWICSYCRKIN